MKKLFFLAAAMLVSASMFAETETSANAGTTDKAVEGASFTIPGSYIAGAGGKQVTPMPNKGIKVRLNAGENDKGGTNNTILVNVNEGCKITALKFTGVTNTDGKAATLSDITVDNVAWDGLVDKTLPAKNASAAAAINITGINAKDSIVFHFSDLGGATQANICLEITYEITAATYTATYKANNGTADADSVNNKAMKVAGPIFKKENAYFVGWNTAADGTGTPYEIDAALTADVTLFAQWKDFSAEKTMTIAFSGDAPAKDVLVALKEGSTGGWMAFFSAKEDDYGKCFEYADGKGLAFDEGKDAVVKVVLDNYLAAGSVICINLISRGDGGGLNILDKDGNLKYIATGKKSNDVQSFYYEVKASDGLASTNEFRLQRAASCYLVSVALGGLGAATAIDNTAAEVKTVKTFENGQLVIIKNGVKYNATGAIVK